jgi:very-short-patch-repair endonuclease
LEHTSLVAVAEFVIPRRRRRGARKLLAACARYSGLEIERARSGAEVAALIAFRDAGYEMPRLNRDVAAVEADLSWPKYRLIIEIDGGPFHLDRGADAERTAHWEAAGSTVRRISSDDVYEHPERLLALALEAKGP